MFSWLAHSTAYPYHWEFFKTGCCIIIALFFTDGESEADKLIKVTQQFKTQVLSLRYTSVSPHIPAQQQSRQVAHGWTHHGRKTEKCGTNVAQMSINTIKNLPVEGPEQSEHWDVTWEGCRSEKEKSKYSISCPDPTSNNWPTPNTEKGNTNRNGIGRCSPIRNNGERKNTTTPTTPCLTHFPTVEHRMQTTFGSQSHYTLESITGPTIGVHWTQSALCVVFF